MLIYAAYMSIYAHTCAIFKNCIIVFECLKCQEGGQDGTCGVHHTHLALDRWRGVLRGLEKQKNDHQ